MVNKKDLIARARGLPDGVIGVACGTGAALFWAAGLVSARHGIAAHLTPLDITVHRLVWAGIAFLPFVRHGGVADVRSIGWMRSGALTLFGGPVLSVVSYAGFLLVPLGHGGVIQPSCAALGGLVLATLVVKERLLATRAVGAVAIVAGLCVIGYEAFSSLGHGGLLGDLAFMTAGFMFAVFGLMLRLWRVPPTRAVAVISVLSLVLIPIEAFSGFRTMIAAGLAENLAQALVQGVFAGAGSTFLFARAVILLGAARAAVFPTLVPPFTLLIGFIALGNVPTLWQLAGLVLVLAGFRLTQMQ